VAVAYDELVRLLGATVGDAKAADAIGEAARSLGLMGSSYEQAQALQILDKLGAQSDIVGIAARLVRVRLVLKR